MIALTSGQEILLPRLLSWIKKGCFAVLDQGLFAGANFLVNILLVRWLEPAQYGAFAAASSVFLLLAAFHTALLTEPMLVFGPGKYAEQFRQYLGILIYSHWAIAGLMAMTLVLSALVFSRLGSGDIAQAMVGLAIASPFILFLWLVRRAFYVRVQPQWAATGGALYLALMLAGVCGLYWGHRLSAAFALVAMGLASLAVSLWLSIVLLPQRGSVGSTPTPGMVLADHWRYGRWSATAVPIIWVPSNIYQAALPIWAGLEGAAAFGVITIFIMPILHIFQAVSLLLFPVLAQQANSTDASHFYLTVHRALKVLVTAGVIYFLFLLICGEWLLKFLYEGKYQNYAYMLPIVGVFPFPYTIPFVLGTALRVMQNLRQIVWCYAISSAVTLTCGLLLIRSFGVLGGVIGCVISTATTSICMALFYTFIKMEKD
jgi:O-antigen/teichoic acid export membrane protein